MELFFPDNLNCILCGMPISKHNKYSLCKPCFDKLYLIKESCQTCGKPTINTDDELFVDKCPFCKKKSFLFDRNISVMEYEDCSKEIIFSLKYKNKTYISKKIAKIMYDSLISREVDILKDMDIISYVPLSSERMKKRGFNQAEKICKYLVKLIHEKNTSTKLEMKDLLCRKANTQRLHKLKAKNRKNELRGVFSLKDGCKDFIKNKNVIIIDDIFTTGSTMNEIAKVLKTSGANKVISLTFLTGKYEK